MHKPTPPLNALRAFEDAARHLSLTKAAKELHVTAGALSHQIRGLEDLLGLKLFERRVRSIALTPAGKMLYPGLQTGFTHIHDAVAGLSNAGADRALVISTPPGFTSKWLAPRLHRFSAAYPEIDARVSSSASKDRKSTRLNSSHSQISYAVFCLKKKKKKKNHLFFQKKKNKKNKN